MKQFHTNIVLHLYHVTSGLCGSSTAHDVRLHGPYAFLSPFKCELEFMPFTDGRWHDNFNIELMKGVLDGQISRDTSVYRATHFQKRCLAFAAVMPNVLSKEC
jgi:hypothetical protein